MFKDKFSTLLFMVSGLMILGSFITKPNNGEKEALILEGVLNFINAVHYQPKPVDDDLSRYVYKKYLENTDGGKRFLIGPEVAELKQYETLIDDQINTRDFEFFNRSVTLMDAAIDRAEGIYKQVIEEPIDFSINEEIELDNDKKEWATDEAGLREIWRKMIKYNVLTRLDNKLEKQEEKKKAQEDKSAVDMTKADADSLDVEEVVILPLDSLLAQSVEKVKDNYDRWFERLHKTRRSDRFEAYISSITTYFDPHTSYFNPKEKQDFDINMGGKLEGIGARLSPDGDYTKVNEIIVGGPAWRGKELEADDLITKVRQDGETEALDITGMRLDDVVQKIRGKKGTKVILTVKKPDGSITDITIERDVVDISESKAKSLLLSYNGLINNVGYIKLPKFYSSFEKEDGNSCAVDVAAEIEKLKNSNVNGIILDLRNNTGGSLNDVVDMSGLFIEEGPIVQVKPRDRDAYVHADDQKDVAYDGPLIVMVNNVSASASEILAAALQDYGRAIIVGSTTFGKGTVQRFYNLDRAFRGANELKPLGNIKMTMQKFFRVDGGSTQLRGVSPDIELPDNFKYVDYGEREYDNALEFSEITPQKYHQDVVELDQLSEVVARSEKRVAGDDTFQLIDENAARIKRNRDVSKYTLNLDGYRAYMDDMDEQSERFEGIMKDSIPELHVQNLQVDFDKITMDESVKAKNEAWIDEVQKDVYLEETLQIMRDMIQVESEYSGIEKRIVSVSDKKIKP